MTTAVTAPLPSRQSQLVERLRTLFEDVAGVDLSAADADTAFIELGLDSLTLTQASIQIKKAFSIKITFRQLMENYRSFATLAEFVDSQMPPDVAPAAPVSANTSADYPTELCIPDE